MDKRRLYRTWMRIRRLKPWVLLIPALVSGIVCVFAMRQNYIRMTELREAVFQADKDNGDVETALRDLREWVYGHMNTALAKDNQAVRPPIQLKYTYERLVAAANAGASASASSNEDLYNQAQKYCEAAIPNGFSGSYRLSCIQSFVKERSLNPASTIDIPKNLYQFDFRAAKWSPDLAGWSLVITIGLVFSSLLLWMYQYSVRWRLARS